MSWQYIWSHQVAIWIWASAVRNCPLGRCRSYSTYPTSLWGPTPRNHRPDTLQHFAPGEQPLTAYNRINIHFWGALALMQDSIWCMLPLPERAVQTFVFLYEFLSGSLPLCTRLSMTTPTCGFTVWSGGSQPQVAEGGRGHSSFLDVTFRPGARSQLITSAGGQRVKSAYTL